MKSFLQKIVFSIAVVLVTAVSVYAQVPQGFNFQAVARGATGDVLADQALGVQVSIIKGTEDGNPIYEESHSVTTNPLGLIQLVIGEGTPGDGQVFSDIDFSNDNYFVKLAIDPAGGNEYEDLGTTRLLSVPYALVAQKAVESGNGPGEIPLNINLNTANSDSAFMVNIEGTRSGSAIIGTAKTDSTNAGVEGIAESGSINSSLQVGTYGEAKGSGSGAHLGIYGNALDFEASSGSRRGVYGQAGSKSKFNYGVFGIAVGDGNGESETDPGNGDFGSFNLGGYFQAYGNLNGNTGVQGEVAGSNGSLRNFGVIGTARTTSDGKNIGLRAEAFNSTTENIGAEAVANGAARNVGFIAQAFSGTSNIALITQADTAAILNGTSIINGDLFVNGNINGGMGSGGSANGETLDSLFLSTPPESQFQRNTAFYPGFIRNSDQNGDFVNLSRTRLQYGNDSDGVSIFNWYDKGGMQVAANDYLNGERASGIQGGYFYMDIAKDGNFYFPLEMGIQNAAEGGRSYFRMNSLARAENQLGPLYSIDISNDPNGTDPDGESAQVFLHGDNTPNFQFGGQSWNNNELAFLNMYGSTSDGNGWFYSNANINVGSDGTDEWGAISLVKSNIAGQTSQETILLDGNSGNINISGSLSQSSDLRLKKEVETLDNALGKTLEMRGVSYTWKTDMSGENPQIGVIAQEVEKIYPEFVRTDENGMKSVNYAQMTAVLIEAVKELSTEINNLKKDNATLQAKFDKQQELENRLSRIENLLNSGSSTSSEVMAEEK